LALRFIVGIQGQTQLRQMLSSVPEVEDALGTREVLAKEFFQAIAAIGQRDLLFGLIPADLRGLASQLTPQLI